jgi:hypothetical protein
MPASVTLVPARTSCFRARQLCKQLTSVICLQLPRSSTSSVGMSSRPRMPASVTLLCERTSFFRARQLQAAHVRYLLATPRLSTSSVGMSSRPRMPASVTLV